MWLDSEINRLGQLYSKIIDPGIETVLPKDDLACIEELSSTELATLKNYLFVPKVKLFLNSEFICYYLKLFSIIWNGKLCVSLES